MRSLIVWCRMHDFNTFYIRLLRTQVEEEIKYLKSVGHSHDLIDDPCIFCYEARRTPGESLTNGYYANKYKCNRLRELENFLSQLTVREIMQCNSTTAGKNSLSGTILPYQHYNTNSMRRPIGQPDSTDVKLYERIEVETNNFEGLLPAMPVNLKF